MSKPAERNVHNADTPDFSVPDDGHGTPTSNTIGILLDACQTAKRITEALLPRSPAPRTNVLARARRETVPSFRHVPPHDFPLRRNAVPDDQDSIVARIGGDGEHHTSRKKGISWPHHPPHSSARTYAAGIRHRRGDRAVAHHRLHDELRGQGKVGQDYVPSGTTGTTGIWVTVPTWRCMLNYLSKDYLRDGGNGSTIEWSVSAESFRRADAVPLEQDATASAIIKALDRYIGSWRQFMTDTNGGSVDLSQRRRQ